MATRRKASIIGGIVYLVGIVMAGGDGTNPWLGASTILVFGWLTFFFLITPLEKEAIDEAAEEIVWMYENEELDADGEYDDPNEEEINNAPESGNSK